MIKLLFGGLWKPIAIVVAVVGVAFGIRQAVAGYMDLNTEYTLLRSDYESVNQSNINLSQSLLKAKQSVREREKINQQLTHRFNRLRGSISQHIEGNEASRDWANTDIPADLLNLMREATTSTNKDSDPVTPREPASRDKSPSDPRNNERVATYLGTKPAGSRQIK